MEVMALFGIVNILIYIGIAVIGIYVVFTIIRLMKQRNDYLRDIRDELKKGNNKGRLFDFRQAEIGICSTRFLSLDSNHMISSVTLLIDGISYVSVRLCANLDIKIIP